MQSLNELSGLLAAIRARYPQARVTSGYRGPDNPLTKRNPNSLHALGSAEDPNAVDVAPIPGVRFEDYVNSIRQSGVPVTQAFDEAKHPFAWTTGPNWHLGQGQAPVAASQYYPQRKPRTLGDVTPRPGPYSFGTISDIGDLAPVNVSAPSQMTLGDLQPDQAALANVPKHKGLFPGKDLAAIAGILGDALSAYGGQQPIFAPAMYAKQRDQREQDFEREKFSAQLDAKRNEQPQFLQNLAAYMQLPPDLKRQYLGMLDATQPIAVSGPQGTQRISRELGPQPGDSHDGYVFLGGDPNDQNSWRPQ